MKITKYGHACLAIEKKGQTLIIDPGDYSKDLVVRECIVGIVVTHAHSDHMNRELIEALLKANPEAMVYGTSEVVKALKPLPVHDVSVASTEQAGPFILAFYPGQHAEIYNGFPDTDNMGVMINDTLYFPGDSFKAPNVAVPILAVPISGPWLKAGEIVDYVHKVKPTRCFPTHNAFLSEIGQIGIDAWLKQAVAPGASYEPLAGGETLAI